MPSAVAVLPLPGCAASRSSEATFCGISLMEASRVLCFPSRMIVNGSLLPTGCRRDAAREVVHGFYFVAACRGDHVALLDAGLGGRAVRGHRRDQRTGRVVRVESKALGDP